MPFKDPAVRRDYNLRYQRLYYERNKAEFIEKNRRRKQDARKFLWERKATRNCAACGETDPRCLDFHHQGRQPKVAGLSQMATDGAAIRSIERELEKCIVLCKNCHAKEHLKHL
jgi:hypothetical protein